MHQNKYTKFECKYEYFASTIHYSNQNTEYSTTEYSTAEYSTACSPPPR